MIPPGEVRTYADVARLAGRPRAARAVANCLAQNYDPGIPCHRVVRSNQQLGGYNRGGTREKARLLEREGVILVGVCRPK